MDGTLHLYTHIVIVLQVSKKEFIEKFKVEKLA